MEVGIILLAVLDSSEELLVLEENTVFDVLCDECENLNDKLVTTLYFMDGFKTKSLKKIPLENDLNYKQHF